MNCLISLCRYKASRLPDIFGAIRGIFFSHTASAVCPPPTIAQAPPHLRHPIQGLFSQHINRVIGRPPALRQVLPPTRLYCTFPPRPVTHFTRRYHRWCYVATVPFIVVGGAMIPDYGYLETVPCTNRTHFVLRSPLEEREHSESRFADLRKKYASIILDPDHPDCVRLNNITSKLVCAVHSHLILKNHDTITVHRSNADSAVEILRRKLGNTWRAQPTMRHLNGLNWEVMVVEDKRVNMWSYPAGKIIATTGLLEVFKTDAEVATVIAHEIGHVVARHWTEKIIYRKCLPRPLRVPFFRSFEREADQIGMMIVAAAGFDPRLAPLAFEKLGHSGRLLSNYPSGKKRSQLLSRSKIMEEALKLYREASPNQDTEGSL